MKKITFSLLLILSGPGHALGSFDGELTINWWANDLSGSLFDNDLDVGTLNIRADGWWDQKWGLRGSVDFSDVNFDGLEDSQRINFDVNRRLFSLSDNTYLAAGVGWESLQLENGDSSDGLRLSLGGRIGFGGVAALYGKSIWMPNLSSDEAIGGLSGVEFETGIVFDPLPFLSVRAGYRRFKLNYDLTTQNVDTISQGIIIGTGIHW